MSSCRRHRLCAQRLGEEFGNPIGTDVTGKMVTALRMLGFDKVFDTDTAADLTIMEEGTELSDRIRGGGVLPLITSCSPAGSSSASIISRRCCRTCRAANRRTR